MHTGKNIKLWRKYRGIKLTALGSTVSLSQQYLSQLEQQKEIPAKYLITICGYLGVSPVAIMESNPKQIQAAIINDLLTMQDSHHGEQIAAIRRVKGLTQTQLGKRLGISKQAISKMEALQYIEEKRLKRIYLKLGINPFQPGTNY